MCKVIKMELFRLKKSMYAYVILGTLLLMVIFGTFIDGSNSSNKSMRNETQKNNIELYVDNYDDNYNTNYANKYEMLTSAFSGNIVPMALLIFSGLFSGAYRKHKFDKNIIGLIRKRSNLIYANAIICGLYNLVVIFVTLGASYIGYILFYPQFTNIIVGDTGKFMSYITTYYLLLFSVSIMMSCFVYIVKNQIVAIIIGLIYGSGIVYGIFDYITSSIGMKNFSLKTYLPLANIYELSMNTTNMYKRSILIAVFFALLALFINIFFYNKEDIAS